MRNFVLAFLCALFLVPFANAAPGAVRCGKLLDVRSGKMLTDQIIQFDAGGTIISLSSASATKLPSGVTPLDLSNATCLPGLIDVHTHLTFDPADSGYAGPRHFDSP